MPLGMFSGLKGLPKIGRDLINAPITKRDLPPILPPAWLMQAGERQGFDPMLEWASMNGTDPAAVNAPDMAGSPTMSPPNAHSAAHLSASPPRTNKKVDRGIFAQDTPEADTGGALSGLKPMMNAAPAKPEAKSGAPSWLDYIGLAGATLQEMGGVSGAVNDFMGNRRALDQEASMNSLIEGLDLTPEELGLVKAGMGKEVLAQRVDDIREGRRYKRDRGDTLSDRREMRGYQVEDRDLGYAHADKTLDRTLGQDQAQFDLTLGENKRQFDARLGFDNRRLNADLSLEAAKLEAAAAKGAQLDGPQLTTIYNNSLKYIDEQAAMLGNFDTIAGASQAFIDLAYGKGSDGVMYNSGKGMGESYNQLTDGRSPRLEAFTSKITPMMRPEGSGSMSDGDREMFRQGVVNIQNRKEGNEYAAAAAVAVRDRQSDYVGFLRENIDINDPTSRQRAQALWDEYARSVPIFDPASGQPRQNLPTFDQWIEQSVGEQNAAVEQGWSMLQSELMNNPKDAAQIIQEFDMTFGRGAAQQVIGQNWGPDAVKAWFGQ